MITSNRTIVHFDMDAFFVSVEELKNPALKGKPVIIGGHSDRGVVAAASYEARRFGVHSAMPAKRARQLCSHAIWIKGDMESYSKFSAVVTEIIRNEAPVVEKASIDEFYLDVSGMDKYFGCLKWTKELQKKVTKESGLPSTFCLAANKLVSKMGAAEAKPLGQLEIPFGTEKDFIAPLSVRKIPGVGSVAGNMLESMGVKTISKLREIPPRYLEKEFGKSGISLWQKAHAEDNSLVIPYHEQKSLSTEQTFEQDTINVIYMKSELVKMTEYLGYELRRMNKLTGCITVKIKYSDFNTLTKQKSIAYCATDNNLLPVVKELFDKLYDRRQLVRLLGIRFTDLVQGNQQINLFTDTTKSISLFQAIDKMKKRFGEQAVTRAICR